MSLKTLIDNAASGDTITLTGSTTDTGPIIIDKPLTIVGRTSPTSGSRISVTINTGIDSSAINVNASNVTLRGLDINHAYSGLGPYGTETTIKILPGGTYGYPDDGNIALENVTVDDCKIHYGKFGVSSRAKSFNVTNCEIYNKETTSTTGRGVAIYSNDGTIEIMNNSYTTAGNTKIEGLHFNFATNDGFVNKRNGQVYYSGNTNNFASTRKWVFFEVGSEKGLSGDSMELHVTGNEIQSTSSAFVVMQPNSADSFDHFSKIVVANNIVPSTFSNGVYQIDGTYTSQTPFNEFSVTPLAYVYGNTEQTGISVTGKVVLGNAVTFRGYPSYPTNINDFASFSAPPPPGPPTYYVSPTGNDSADGLSLANAFATIPHALSIAASGSTITLASGTHTLSARATITKPVTIRGAIDMSTIVNGSSFNGWMFHAESVTGITIENIKIQSGGSNQQYPLHFYLCQYLVFRNLVNLGCYRSFMSLNTVSGIEIDSCDTGVATNGFGIAIASCSTVNIQSSTIRASAWGSVGIFPSSQQPSVATTGIVFAQSNVFDGTATVNIQKKASSITHSTDEPLYINYLTTADVRLPSNTLDYFFSATRVFDGLFMEVYTNTASYPTLEPIFADTNNFSGFLPIFLGSFVSAKSSANTIASGSSVNIEASKLIGGGRIKASVPVKKFASSISNAHASGVISNGSISSTVSLTLTNSDSIGFEKIMGVLQNTWRPTTDGLSSRVAFSIKFIDPNSSGTFVSSPGTQNYKISTPQIANRTHLKIYRENPDGTSTYVTRADRISGENYTYSFTLNTNSVYTAADSGEMSVISGSGSDPHITTLSGRHWVMSKIRGRDRDLTLLADDKMSIKGHIHGYPNGDFFSHADITEGKKKVVAVDFQKKKIKILDNTKAKIVNSQSRLENGSISGKNQTTLFVDGFNPGGVFLHVDFNQRYISPIFNHQITNTSLRGIIAEK